jgi:hypothetical protein
MRIEHYGLKNVGKTGERDSRCLYNGLLPVKHKLEPLIILAIMAEADT